MAPRSGRGVRLTAGTVLLTLAAGLAAACAAGPATDAWARRGIPVKYLNEPAPPRPGTSPVDGIPGLKVALEDRVIASGGLVRPVASGCGTAQILPAFTCRVTYLGRVVTYHVTTRPGDGSFAGTAEYTWRARAQSLIVTRSGVEAAMWRAYASRATAMSCDSGFPALQRVRPGTTLRQRCYFKPVSRDPAFGTASGNRDRTVAVTITVDDGGLTLTDVTQ